MDPTSLRNSSRLLLVLSVNPFNAFSVLSIVNMQVGAPKTSVRADSAASRGSTDEIAAERAKILMRPS
ncbi:hypothetical protein BH10PSE8_BH10PSE8_13750 [soil metagenome]